MFTVKARSDVKKGQAVALDVVLDAVEVPIKLKWTPIVWAMRDLKKGEPVQYVPHGETEDVRHTDDVINRYGSRFDAQ